MLILKTNELNNNIKKTMKQRVLSSVFIVSFFIILFLLGWLADNVNGWSPLPEIGREICAWLLLIYLLPTIIICAHEINNVFFKFNWFTKSIIILEMLLLVYGPTMVYFLKYYHDITSIEITENISQINTVTNVFSIILAISILVAIISNTVILIVNKINTFKNWVILNLLVGVISGFYLGSLFFLLVRGWLTLIWLMLIVIGSDSFSYFGGVLFGKHQMAKNISPKKTWEGFGIGQVITIVAALLILFGFSFIQHNPNVLKQIMGVQFDVIVNGKPHEGLTVSDSKTWWAWMAIITILLSLLSVFGDLAYSWFKRKYRIKDYGNLIPGHGGIIDRIDSHSVVISFYFVLNFFIALFANTVVFFEPIQKVLA